MHKLTKIVSVIALLVVFAVAGFQAGKTAGFRTGSEWALVQADIVARESGVFMPIYMEGDSFRVIVKQPKGLYKKAWDLADTYEDARNALCIDSQKKAGHKQL